MKRERYDGSGKPWNRQMTLCIAAKALDHSGDIPLMGKRCVVVASDRRTETASASAEIEHKFCSLGDQWAGLLAGVTHQARELLDLYREHIQAVAITEENAVEQLRIPLRKMRMRLAEDHVQRTHAISYESFLDKGKLQLPDDIFRQTTFEVTAQKIEAELILIGWFPLGFQLFHCSNWGVVNYPHFATIGSGGDLASSVLYQREQMSWVDLPTTLYDVYEAKTLSEIAPGVGKQTDYSVLYAPEGESSHVRHKFVSEEGVQFLKRQFRRFGPKPSKIPSLPSGWTY